MSSWSDVLPVRTLWITVYSFIGVDVCFTIPLLQQRFLCWESDLTNKCIRIISIDINLITENGLNLMLWKLIVSKKNIFFYQSPKGKKNILPKRGNFFLKGFTAVFLTKIKNSFNVEKRTKAVRYLVKQEFNLSQLDYRILNLNFLTYIQGIT